ncbi:rhodanese-like domain-containing protein [Henriciella litoralis]|uniref:rhodanese-like domain-containing protein n=1 Tax=Henriciella litoralis TaxID=568102 RepID=UPI000A01A270|nr:rhodanese-like domain-containing protein [Henriciella litoralis]
MGARRNTLISLTTLIAFVATGLLATASAQVGEGAERPSSQIDYDGFLNVSDEVRGVRAARLVSLEDFSEMATQPDTIILDARSESAYRQGHIDGAVHLSFSDFSDERLADLIPSRDTRILIYCNNNFSDDVEPVLLKRSPLALNIPTFINLYGYGYRNVYELADVVETSHEDLNWTRAQPALSF